MEFFGIGGSEFIILLVIAILLFGPDKIPSMAQQVGKTIRDFRRYTSDLTKEFNDATGGLRDEFTNITSDIRNELAATQADLRSQLDLTGLLNPDTATATVAAATTTTTEPLTETSVASTAVTDAPVATIEPEPSPTITVMTPYAESLAAESANGVIAEPSGVETNGTTPALRVATKADPFADLAPLIVAQPGNAPVTITENVAPMAVAEPESVEPEVVVESVVVHSEPEPTPVMQTNGKAKVIGSSVAGSKYTRRKSA